MPSCWVQLFGFGLTVVENRIKVLHKMLNCPPTYYRSITKQGDVKIHNTQNIFIVNSRLPWMGESKIQLLWAES